jgi:hypothetical protein
MISESELDHLSKGSTESIYLNFALFLLPISFTLIVTLLTATISSDRLHQSFVSISAITLIAGLVLLVFWWRNHVSSKALVAQIKNRMPPPPAIQEAPGDPGASPPPSEGGAQST